jgi:transcription initiation factor TFIID subunit TAF12
MNNKENMKEVPMVTLDDLVAGITNHNKLMTAEATLKDMRTEVNVYKDRIKFLEEAGNKLAFLMLNGSTHEMRKAIWEWRELVPTKNEKGS